MEERVLSQRFLQLDEGFSAPPASGIMSARSSRPSVSRCLRRVPSSPAVTGGYWTDVTAVLRGGDLLELVLRDECDPLTVGREEGPRSRLGSLDRLRVVGGEGAPVQGLDAVAHRRVHDGPPVRRDRDRRTHREERSPAGRGRTAWTGAVAGSSRASSSARHRDGRHEHAADERACDRPGPRPRWLATHRSGLRLARLAGPRAPSPPRSRGARRRCRAAAARSFWRHRRRRSRIFAGVAAAAPTSPGPA